MTCREAQSLIVPFIENRLTDEQKEAFIHHVENCSACYDELEVYFIVFSGIRQLDGSFQEDISDFKSALKAYITMQKESMEKKRHRITRRWAAAILFVMFLAFSGGALYNVYKDNNDFLHDAMVKVESVFVYNKAEAVKKSVEYTLEDSFKRANFKKIVRNEIIKEIEEESDEKNSTD